MAKEDLVVMVFEMLRFQLDGKSNDEESAIDSVPQGTVFNDRLKQFLAAAYCAAELASVPATAELIVKCGVVRLVLDILHHIHQQNLSKQKPSAEECENNSKLNGHHSPVLNREAEVEVMTSLWSILATLSLNPMYLHSIISCPLLSEVVKTESELGLSACRIKLSQLLLEISKDVADKDFAVHPELASNLPGLIAAVRHLLAHPMGRDASDIACENGDFLQVITLSLHSLVYFAKGVPSSRTQILGTDLLELLRSAVPNNELQGRQETFLVIMLLYLLSTEESLAIRLLDADLHGLIVGHGSFLEAVSIKAKSTQKSVHDGRKVALVQNFGDYSKMKEMHFIRRSGDLLAATCLNLAIKRGTLGDGILPMLLSLFKNCKSSRVMWIARCLSYVSAHPRAKGYI